MNEIKKLYISGFLTGLVFWYGIEKIFMTDIGIDPLGIGLVAATLLIVNLVLDIPSGILADRWSRKGSLAIGAAALGICSLILGSSNSISVYLVGYIFYGIYATAVNGAFEALIYDTLHEQKKAKQYSKVIGRANALFLAGAGLANIASGFLASTFSYRFTFYITIAVCVINFWLILTIKEPKFHKAEIQKKPLHQTAEASKELLKNKLLRGLAIIMSLSAVVELFKSDFGQLYFLRYTESPEVIGVLWAIYAFAWALGSILAHRYRSKLTSLVLLTTLPVILMSLIDNSFSILLFMVQAVASAALLNQIETRVQESTKSSVRASILSVLSVVAKIVTIPASFALGWIFRAHGELAAVWFVAVVSAIVLIYWLIIREQTPSADKPVKGDKIVPNSPPEVI
jgi:MFS family permease